MPIIIIFYLPFSKNTISGLRGVSSWPCFSLIFYFLMTRPLYIKSRTLLDSKRNSAGRRARRHGVAEEICAELNPSITKTRCRFPRSISGNGQCADEKREEPGCPTSDWRQNPMARVTKYEFDRRFLSLFPSKIDQASLLYQGIRFLAVVFFWPAWL